MRRSRLWTAVFVLLAVLTSATPALADDPHYTLPEAVVTAEVGDDGTVRVTQDLTFSFNGEGHGAYVDVPRFNMSTLSDITVSEAAHPYQKGPDAEIGVERPAGTFGEKTCSTSGAHRIVWYFDAAPGSTRTFRIGYTIRRAVTIHDEHAFLALPVWGRNWRQTLERLDVTVRLPRAGRKNEEYIAQGDPADVLEATVGGSKQETKATAENVRGGRTVALHLAFPTAQLDLPANAASLTSSVRRMPGDGAALLEKLRDGKVPASFPGIDCPERSAAQKRDDKSTGTVILQALVLIAIFAGYLVVRAVFGRGDHGDRYRRGDRYHRPYRSRRRGGWSGGGSRSSGGSSGGGGGAW